MSKILSNLGIYGIPETVENFILVGLHLGDPILLIGAPGTAKTNSVEMIGQAIKQSLKYENNIEFSYQVYDSSKLNFEDLIGFLNPEKLASGEMDFIHTPTTIWKKDLVSFDEFNRIDPDRQSNLFEIIRSRKCMGLDTGTSFIINCMNPHGDTGTEILSEALVDRHLAFVEFPEFHSMPSEIQDKIIDQIGNFDCRGYKYWTNTKYDYDFEDGKKNDKLVKAGSYIRQLIELSIKVKQDLEKDIGGKITNLVKKAIGNVNTYITSINKDKSVLFSGRRAGLVKRGVIAYRAIEIAKGLMSDTAVRSMQDTLLDIVPMTVPIGVSGSIESDEATKVKEKIKESIRLYWPEIENASSTYFVDRLYELFNTTDIYRKFDIILSTEFTKETTSCEAWNNILSSCNEYSKKFLNFISIFSTAAPDKIPDNVKATIGNLRNAKEINNDRLIETVTFTGNATLYIEEIENLVTKYENEPVISLFISMSCSDFANNKNASVRQCEQFMESLRSNITHIESTLKETVI